jgi:hypothetical protein
MPQRKAAAFRPGKGPWGKVLDGGKRSEELMDHKGVLALVQTMKMKEGYRCGAMVVNVLSF